MGRVHVQEYKGQEAVCVHICIIRVRWQERELSISAVRVRMGSFIRHECVYVNNEHVDSI